MSGDDSLEFLRADNARLGKALKREKFRTEELVEAVYRAASESLQAQARVKVPRPPADRRKKGSEVALLHATDFQCGKVSATFNIGILGDRISLLARKVNRITSIHRADHPVNEVVVMLGGDMVEGLAIFPGQVYEVEATLFEQLFACARIIEQLCRDLLGSFDRVRVVTEYGNHGRLGRKGDYPAADNVDRLAYALVEARLGHENRISFHHSPEFYSTVTIGAYKALLIHGDEIGSAGGIVRKCTSWASGAIPYAFSDVYIGHFHTPQTLALPNAGRAFITGSPESGNSYASEVCAATGIPSQRLHFVDPERGRITSEYTIWLD